MSALISKIFALFLLFLCIFSSTSSTQAQEVSVISRYSDALGAANRNLSPNYRHNLAERLLLLSSYYQIDPRLLLAIVSVESSWRAGAVSPVGAAGYGQLMPATAASLKVQSLEPYENLDGTARYLRRLISLYASYPPLRRIQLAAASYNAGPYAVKRYAGIPPYRETRQYVKNVVSEWEYFSRILRSPSKSDINTIILSSEAQNNRFYQRQYQISKLSDTLKKSNFKNDFPKKVNNLGKVNNKGIALAKLPKIYLKNQKNHERTIGFNKSNYIPTQQKAEEKVRYERSRSFVARLFGIKHRVVEQIVVRD